MNTHIRYRHEQSVNPVSKMVTIFSSLCHVIILKLENSIRYLQLDLVRHW